MKNSLMLIMGLFAFMSAYSQTVQEQRIPVAANSIPKIVFYSFQNDNPDVKIKSWYVTHLVFWENDLSAGWYSGWYGNRQIITYSYEKPNYFEVEFYGDPGEVSRSVYNGYGYCYETRTLIKGLPKAVIDSLKSSIYADWKISPTMEKIEKVGWPEPFYRIHVHKGTKSRLIRISQNGEIIQEKKISEL